MKADYLAGLMLGLISVLLFVAAWEVRRLKRQEPDIEEDAIFRREQLRQASRQAAAAEFGTAFSGLALLVSAVGAAAVIGSLWATQDQLKLLQNESRPWLHLKGHGVSDPLVIDADGLKGRIDLHIENVGHSPAVQVIFHVVAFMPKEWGQTSTHMAEICDWLRSQTVSLQLAGSTIFPGEVADYAWPISLSRADVDFGITRWQGRGFPLPVVGCIDYAFSHGGERHRTPIEIEVVESDGSPNGYHFVYPSDSPITPDKIRLVSNGSVPGLSAD